MNGNLLITMSGGTTTVINATLAGVIRRAQESSKINKIYAGYPGISGFLNGNVIELTNMSEHELKVLVNTPGSGFIGTTRVRPLDELETKLFCKIANKNNIQYFINIGGNGTIKQTMHISTSIGDKITSVALPKTVDNDLGDIQFEKMLYTPGFPSCVNYWRNKVFVMNQENLGAFSHDQVLIAQTFGRETGFLAGAARIADVKRETPLIILLPEDQKTSEQVMSHIINIVNKHKRAIVILSEGYKIKELGYRYDKSGQIMYSSSNTSAAQELINLCFDNGIQARGFIPGFDQRIDNRYTTQFDIDNAYKIGEYAIEEINTGNKEFFVSIDKNLNIISIPFTEINNFSRKMPDRWISYNNFDVTDSYVSYLEKLLVGPEYKIKYINDKPYYIENKF